MTATVIPKLTMRMKRDHMGNDQLLPGYNIQCAVCDGFIAAFDVYQYASDMYCFQPLMEMPERKGIPFHLQPYCKGQ